MKASYTGQNPQLRAAVAYINDKLDGDNSFWTHIRNKKKYSYTELSSAEIERRVHSSKLIVRVRLWTPKPEHAEKYRKTVAITSSKHPNTLFYHTRFLKRTSIGDKVGTIAHEFVHNVDRFDDGNPKKEMGHGDNSSVGKDDSAPYWIGGHAALHYRNNRNVRPESEIIPYVHEDGDLEEGEVVEETYKPLRSFDEEIRDAETSSE
jgi:hypothetical protein